MTEQKMFGYKFNIVRDLISYKETEDTHDSVYHQRPDTIVYKTDEYPDIVSSIDFPVNSTAYVVYAVWSSGDSFSWEQYGSAEPFGIFASLECAREFSSTLCNSDAHVIDCSDGQRFEYKSFPWDYYFSDLEYVEVISVKLLSDKSEFINYH